MSENHIIKNGLLSAEISSHGAELWSLKCGGAELLWQGDEKYWKSRSPNLFPYVGRLWQKTYIYDGREYNLKIHGFVRNSELSPENITDSAVSFTMTNSDETLAVYPFEFKYTVTFEIKNGALFVTFEVENRDNKTMYFGAGGHPGINLPLDSKHKFEDYSIYFENGAKPKQAVFSDDCFFLNGYTPFELQKENRLDMKHKLFDNDAIILKDHGGKVTLKPRDKGYGVEVGFEDFRYLGLWHKPKTDAPYVCIEPWSSLPSLRDVITDITKQKDLIKLEAGEKYKAGYHIKPVF